MDPVSILTVIEYSVKSISALAKYYSDVRGAKEDIQRLTEEIQSYSNVLQQVKRVAENQESSQSAVLDSLTEEIKLSEEILRQINERLDPGKEKRLFRRVGLQSLKWPFTSNEVNEYILRLERHKTTLITALTTHQTFAIRDLKKEQKSGFDDLSTNLKQNQQSKDQEHQLEKLHYAQGAAFNDSKREHKRRCTPGTRVVLLAQIEEWSDKKEKPIFWLCGMAGTGKSTISQTIAEDFSDRNFLGASFFFSRGEGDVGRAAQFVSTLALQLAGQDVEFRHHLCASVAANPLITRQGLRIQWKELIISPLIKCSSNSTQRNLVIDALDECDNDDDIRLLLQLFTELEKEGVANISIFVTSRPEVPIRLGFNKLSSINFEQLILHDVAPTTVDRDISVFLEQRFQEIREEHELAADWPGKECAQLLVRQADRLFIYAETACRFIGRHNLDPDEQLQLILEAKVTDTAIVSHLDAIYMTVLQKSVANDCSENERRRLSLRFRKIIGSVVTSFDTFSLVSLSNLASISLAQVKLTLSLHYIQY